MYDFIKDVLPFRAYFKIFLGAAIKIKKSNPLTNARPEVFLRINISLFLVR